LFIIFKLAFLDKGEEILSRHRASSHIDFNANDESMDVQNHESIEVEEEAEQDQAASQQVTDEDEPDVIDNNEDLVQNEPPALEIDSIDKSGPPADMRKPAPGNYLIFIIDCKS
jgi:cellulose biosynthesis protein BcsQ